MEQMLSHIIKNRNFSLAKTIQQSDINLIKRIKKQKLDVINKRFDPTEVDLVCPEVANSWLRSHEYGLDLYKFRYAPVVDGLAYKELIREKGLLLKAADPYIHKIETMLSSSQFIILLSDEKGVMLRVADGCRDHSGRLSREFGLVPGSEWNERTVGTCAHAISLLLEAPIQICGPEHYHDTFNQVCCSSAPIFDANHNLAGTLSIGTLSFQYQSAHSLALAAAMAWAIQSEFQLALDREILSKTLDASDEAVITINKKGIITKCNLTARKVLNCLEQDVAGLHYKKLLGTQPLIESVLEKGKSIFNTIIEMERRDERLLLRSAQPIKEYPNSNLGCIMILKKMGSSRRGRSKSVVCEAAFTFDKIVGSSAQFKRSIEKAKRFAPLDAPILIQGESGTGKEVYTQAIHNQSRPEGPFVAINCAAIPQTLVESELFGYESGAFTGAERQGRAGKIELADGGTLFLDEIGEMSLEIQPVLLRVLEEKKVMRVGGNRYIPVNFRLITATNKNLLEMVQKNKFRQDLYYRLATFKIDIPPLRERGPDIIRLAKYFIAYIAKKQQISLPLLDDATVFQLLKYNWPGNVRQLENAMLYAVNTCNGKIIMPADLPEEIRETDLSPHDEIKLIKPTINDNNNLSIKEMEKIAIIETMLSTENNVSEAAKILKMSRSTLYRKIKEYNLTSQMSSRK